MHSTLNANGLASIISDYDTVLCDVWGVLHNGITVWQEAAEALQKARSAGVCVVMITNAPRPKPSVIDQLAMLNCPAGVFDDLVTSGDVTRALIQQINGKVYHIGPERDYALYEGLNVEFGSPQEVAGIVCTGLFDDRSEHPDDYTQALGQYIELGLPFICANPDIVVEVGNQMLWCAGALARKFDELGGETKIVGKPYAPIYEMALEKAVSLSGKPADKSKTLAIGDGLPTDVLGAKNNNIDCLFITNGIHAADYTSSEVDEAALQNFLEQNDVSPRYWIKSLTW